MLIVAIALNSAYVAATTLTTTLLILLLIVLTTLLPLLIILALTSLLLGHSGDSLIDSLIELILRYSIKLVPSLVLKKSLVDIGRLLNILIYVIRR